MTEENKATQEPETSLDGIEPIIVQRNNVAITHEATQVERGKKNKGNIYFLPNIDHKNESQVKTFLLDYLGLGTVFKMVWQKYRQICQASAATATNEDEEVNLEQLIKYLSELSFRGESKGDLEKQLKELLEVDMVALVQKQAELAKAGNAQGLRDIYADYEELLSDIARVKSEIVEASRPRKPKTDTGETTPAEAPAQ